MSIVTLEELQDEIIAKVQELRQRSGLGAMVYRDSVWLKNLSYEDYLIIRVIFALTQV